MSHRRPKDPYPQWQMSENFHSARTLSSDAARHSRIKQSTSAHECMLHAASCKLYAACCMMLIS